MTAVMRVLGLTLFAIMLAACAVTPPFDSAKLSGVDKTLSYQEAVTDSDVHGSTSVAGGRTPGATGSLRGRRIMWGGSIIETRNLAQHTEVVVLAYPLDAQAQPLTSKSALGRFVLIWPGYLESADYAPGRWLSVVGDLDGVRDEPLGESRYIHPVIQVQYLYLWPLETGPAVSPRFHIGVGVRL
ncbi:MAG: Slp family lipoprotein [Gammaproteobacteria bacterium]